jgi:hypothetical protein
MTSSNRLAAVALVALLAPAPQAGFAATTSDACPDTGRDTNAFLTAATVAAHAPRGPIALVVVNDEAARERGLMCVVLVPARRGMLFVFPPPDAQQGFWMKNTLVPLDMVFVRGDGTVSSIAANVPATPSGTPDDKVARAGGLGRYVIELAAGEAARLGIVAGTKLRFPAQRAKES